MRKYVNTTLSSGLIFLNIFIGSTIAALGAVFVIINFVKPSDNCDFKLAILLLMCVWIFVIIIVVILFGGWIKKRFGKKIDT